MVAFLAALAPLATKAVAKAAPTLIGAAANGLSKAAKGGGKSASRAGTASNGGTPVPTASGTDYTKIGLTAAKTALRLNSLPEAAVTPTIAALVEAGYPAEKAPDFAKTMIAMAASESTVGSRLNIR